MLDRIMKSDASRASNINDILNMASKGNYNGVEIDYEEFSDTAWKGFTVFCSQLYDALKAKGLGMRVCLESYAPISEGSLPAGPEYTIMAYSLHWEDSDPGPRADYAFIKQVAQKLDTLPGDKRMAFAAGGYDWASNGSCNEVTELDAAKLAQKSTDVQRDSQSGALHFTYKSNGITHTVWYSDEQTLKSWINQANSLGIGNVAVWKMGGNTPETLQMLGGSR
jgi:spore germination protein YaaH